jgi:hypothetical protein
MIFELCSKVELGGQLQQSRRVGAHNVPKRWAADVAIDGGGTDKLSVVRHGERLDAEFQSSRLRAVPSAVRRRNYRVRGPTVS